MAGVGQLVTQSANILFTVLSYNLFLVSRLGSALGLGLGLLAAVTLSKVMRKGQ